MIKQTKTTNGHLRSYPANIGLGVLSVATVIGMLKTPDHPYNRYIIPGQTVKVESNNITGINNPIQREKEDTSQQYVSYSETQRTPPRSGKY